MRGKREDTGTTATEKMPQMRPQPALAAQQGAARPAVVQEVEWGLIAHRPQLRQSGQEEKADGEGGPQGVQCDDEGEGHGGEENSGQSRAQEQREGLHTLGQAGAFRELLPWDDEGRHRLKAGRVEGGAHAPQSQGGHNHGDGQLPQQEPARHQSQGHQSDGTVGQGHDLPAVEAVGHRSGEEREDPLGQQSRHGGQREHSGGAGAGGQVPDEGILRDGAGQDRYGLPQPEHGELPFPCDGHGMYSSYGPCPASRAERRITALSYARGPETVPEKTKPLPAFDREGFCAFVRFRTVPAGS